MKDCGKELSEKDKEKIMNKIIVVEFIYFVVSCVDNIVHPPQDQNVKEEKNSDLFSKEMHFSKTEFIFSTFVISQ